MLRENKDRFDLVISDVHMPDMDGFSLLEQVGLEMDLPVIMLSANGDTELVMKGVTHGACDYLVKPVRLEELKNIWQHVVRKKKVEPQDRTNCNNQQKRPGGGCEGQASSGMGNLDQDGKSGKRRKDQYEEEHESNDENEHDNEDSSAQKKPRVVWSVELHRKFVAAVDQLGFEKAVPKKILELMNVDKLTRENVASHLQKYRLYLKRISNVANQQANMVAALGAADPSYLRMNAINFNHHYNSSGQVPNNALRPLPPAGMLGRLNSSAGLGIHGLSPPGTAPLGHGQIGRNAVTMTDYKFQSLWLGGEQNGNILQGLPTSLELPCTSDNSRMCPLSTGFSDAKGTDTNLGGSGNSLVGLLDSSLLYQGHAQESQSQGPLGSQPSPGASDSFRCNGNWPNGVQAASFPSRSNYQSGGIMHTTSGLGGGSGEMNGVLGNAQMPVTTTGSSCVTQSQPALLGGSMSFGGYGSKGVWDDNRGLDALQHSDYSSSFSVAQGACPSLPGGSGMANGSAVFGLTGMADYDPLGAAASSQHHGAENSAPSGYTAGNAGSLEDVVTAMIKREPESSALKGW